MATVAKKTCQTAKRFQAVKNQIIRLLSHLVTLSLDRNIGLLA